MLCARVSSAVQTEQSAMWAPSAFATSGSSSPSTNGSSSSSARAHVISGSMGWSVTESLLELFAQPSPATVNVHPHGVEGNLQDRRDLVIREVLDLPQDQGAAVRLLELVEGLSQLAGQRRALDLVGGRGLVAHRFAGQQFEARGRLGGEPPAAEQIEARIPGDLE